VNDPQKVTSRLVVARSYATVLLQARKEVLNQMTRLVQIARLLVRCPRGNHHGLDRVQFTASDGSVKSGIVLRLNMKTASVHNDEGQNWKVSPGLLLKIATR